MKTSTTELINLKKNTTSQVSETVLELELRVRSDRCEVGQAGKVTRPVAPNDMLIVSL